MIGRNIVTLRGSQSQQSIADGMRELGYDWSQATVWSVEKGKRPIRLTEAESLASLLMVSVEDLLALPAWYALEDYKSAADEWRTKLKNDAEVIERILFDLAEAADAALTEHGPDPELDDAYDPAWLPELLLRNTLGNPYEERSAHAGPYSARYFAARRDRPGGGEPRDHGEHQAEA